MNCHLENLKRLQEANFVATIFLRVAEVEPGHPLLKMRFFQHRIEARILARIVQFHSTVRGPIHSDVTAEPPRKRWFVMPLRGWGQRLGALRGGRDPPASAGPASAPV